jgi:SAM-dependent methyltransferase
VRRTITRLRKRLRWETQWRNAAKRPAWLEEGPRPQVCAARESGWIPAGSSVIDLGCGLGHTAAWLAGLGHRVVGVDVSGAAVRRARQLHGDVPGLHFERVNVGRPIRVDERYDLLLDLGCLHQLSLKVRPRYGANVRGLTAPGSRLLYLMRVWGNETDPSPEAKAAVVQEILGPGFELEWAEDTEMQASHAAHVHPGVELRFVRR